MRSFKEQEIIRRLLINYQESVIPTAYMKQNQIIGKMKLAHCKYFGCLCFLFVASDKPYPVIVSANLNILSLSSFNDVSMTFTAQFRFQQEWNDFRLRFNDSYFSADDYLIMSQDPKQKIWVPDTFFQNEQYGQDHQVDKPNNFIKIRSDGTVKYSKRYVFVKSSFSCRI